jgi:hypothetical protein
MNGKRHVEPDTAVKNNLAAMRGTAGPGRVAAANSSLKGRKKAIAGQAV